MNRSAIVRSVRLQIPSAMSLRIYGVQCEQEESPFGTRGAVSMTERNDEVSLIRFVVLDFFSVGMIDPVVVRKEFDRV